MQVECSPSWIVRAGQHNGSAVHGRAATADHDECGHRTSRTSALIFFSSAWRRHEFPWLVELLMQLKSTNAAAAPSSRCARTVPLLVPIFATVPGALFQARRQVSPPSSFSLSAQRADLFRSDRRGSRGQRQRHPGQTAAARSSKAAGGAWAAQGQGSRSRLPSAETVRPATCAQIWRARG